MRAGYRVRQVVNAINFATLVGLVLAAVARARLERGPDGIVLATGARRRLLRASAFTIGNVVITQQTSLDPQLLAHEARHSTQWACCVLLFLPLYGFAAAWSWLRCGDHWSRNVFEQRAGLTDGGYVENPVRHLRGSTRA